MVLLGCTPGTDDASSATEITGAKPLTTSSTTETATSTTTGVTSTATSSSSTTTDDSSSTIADPGYCGDEIVQDGEACDLGPANSKTGACTPECVLAVCGDGLVYAGVEECDLGEENADDGACTSACQLAACGDGLVHAGVEECDGDEHNADSAACTSTCPVNVCGDGLVHTGVEECDDVDSQFSGGGDGCSAECTREQAFFISKDRYTGDLGGPAGADALCSEAAKWSIKLPWPEHNNTIFRAWIADPECPIDRRLPHADRPYVRLDGQVIAEGWDDLVDGLDAGAAQMNEYGIVVEEVFNLRVWTALDGDGSMLTNAAAKSCNFWTLAGDSFFGAVGKADLGGYGWSRWIYGEEIAQAAATRRRHLLRAGASRCLPGVLRAGYCAAVIAEAAAELTSRRRSAAPSSGTRRRPRSSTSHPRRRGSQWPLWAPCPCSSTPGSADPDRSPSPAASYPSRRT
ncbi:MAG: hypothetical protein R3B09_34605 [Nannocystaceae bacterium]